MWLITSFLRHTCLLIPFFLWAFSFILFYWNQCHYFFIATSTSNSHHAWPLCAFQWWRPASFTMILTKLFLHPAWHALPQRGRLWLTLFNQRIVGSDNCNRIVGISWGRYVGALSVGCTSLDATLFYGCLATSSDNVTGGCRRINGCIRLALHRIIII